MEVEYNKRFSGKRRAYRKRGHNVIRSMTGYGRGEVSDGSQRVVVELRSVNHRYTDIFIKLPKSLAALEDRLRQKVGDRVFRGRVEIFVTWEEYGEKERSVKVNLPLAAAYWQALRELQQRLGLAESPRLENLLALPELFAQQEEEVDLEAAWSLLAQAGNKALDELIAMRGTEGGKLVEDIIHRIGRIEHFIERIEGRAPEILNDYRRRLRERITELLGGEAPVDEGRLELEVALFADRSNATEEVVRLESHLRQMRDVLRDEAVVGRKLDFLLQEMNREINTIGSKANDAETARLVVEVKSELEKIREQMQNVE